MTFVKIALFLVASFAALLFFSQRSLLFPAPAVGFPERLPDYVTHIVLDEGYALFLPPTRNFRKPGPLLILSHGNAETAHWQIDDVLLLREAGMSVLLLEYPGYAGAPGRPSFDSIRRSSLAAYDIITQREDVDPARIIAYGRSIGGGAASLIAAERPVAVLGLESSFSTLSRLVAEKGMPSLFLRDRFDNEKIVSNLNVPVFLFHGANDTIIPIHHSKRLRQSAKTKGFHEVVCGHNDCPTAWPALLEFLSKHQILNQY